MKIVLSTHTHEKKLGCCLNSLTCTDRTSKTNSYSSYKKSQKEIKILINRI